MDRDASSEARDEPSVGSRIYPDPNVLAKRVDEEIVLVHLETNRIYELNPTGASLWDALAGGPTRAELEQLLALEFDVQPDQLALEVEEMLGQLADERLIRSD